MLILELDYGFVQEFILNETKKITYNITLLHSELNKELLSIQKNEKLKFYYSYFDEDNLLLYNNTLYFIDKRDLRKRQINIYDKIRISYKIKNLSDRYDIYLAPYQYLGKLIIEKYDSIYYDETKQRLIYFNTDKKLYVIYSQIISMSDRTILIS